MGLDPGPIEIHGSLRAADSDSSMDERSLAAEELCVYISSRRIGEEGHNGPWDDLLRPPIVRTFR